MTYVRIITEPLGGTPLSQLLQRGGEPSNWLAPTPRSAVHWRERAERRAGERDWASRWRTLAPALDAGGLAAERLA
ncbi:MAG: hypothetical protein ACHQRK_04010, partial [Gemmatimonadales bacterium]